MSNNNQAKTNQTDLQQAADHVKPDELAKNMNQAKQQSEEQPQNLASQEQTPFIDDSLRTDK